MIRALAGLFVFVLAAPASAAPRPSASPFQVVYVGIDAPELSARYQRAADARVQRGLTKTKLPTATPEQVAQWTDPGALQAFRACAATSAPRCALPAPLDRFQLIIALSARPAKEPLSAFTFAAFDEQGRRQVNRSITMEPGSALAMWEYEAETLPQKFALRTPYDVQPPLPLAFFGTVSTVAGGVAGTAGALLIRDAMIADTRLRGTAGRPVQSYEEARVLAREGDLKQKLGVGALALGAVAVVAGGWLLYEGLTPQAVPAVLPTPGGVAVVFTGRWP